MLTLDILELMKFVHSLGSFLKVHLFSVLIVILLVLLAGGSYLRFIVQHDYLVSFAGECDPYTESCYEDCDDDECTQMYYYTIVERHAAELYELCGPNILECEEAYECQADVAVCSITYCDPEIDGEDTCIHVTQDES